MNGTAWVGNREGATLGELTAAMDGLLWTHPAKDRVYCLAHKPKGWLGVAYGQHSNLRLTGEALTEYDYERLLSSEFHANL